ncbi:MAG: ATP-binding protein [Nannocystales bacterium]
MLGGRKPQGRAAFVSSVVVASLCLVAFSAWCVVVIRDVSILRAEVGERVHWMQVVGGVEQAARSGDERALDAAIAALDTELPALIAAGRDDPALAEAAEASATAVRTLNRDALLAGETPSAFAALVPALRRQTAARSVELGRYWTALYMLVGVSVVFALTTLVLYVRSHAQRVRQAQHDAARLHTQLLRADRLSALGTLAATVAHEINNPLSFVLSNLELVEDQLRGTPTNPELQTSISQAREGVRRVATIVRDLRGISHPGKAARRTPVDIHRPLDAAIRICEGEARDRAQIVRDYGRVPRVHADEAQLGQVFLNILVNAIQAIEPGQPAANTITVRTRKASHGVRLEICDTGPGIDPRHVDRLFEPFVTTKDVGEGTGLGLYVCRSIVESMQGRIHLEPMTDGGTRATITLPVAPHTEEVGAPSVPIHDPTPTADQHLRILIIDDEEMLTSALARSLRGHEVHTANRGSLAVDVAKTSHFDLILCDLIMPEMTGMDVFEALQAVDDSVRKRFVFMTGATVTSEAKAFADSIDAPVLEKPFSRAELLGVLDRFL